jgi:hypothetical protein
MLNRFILLVLCTISWSTYGTIVYTCIENGVTIYSQTPCSLVAVAQINKNESYKPDSNGITFAQIQKKEKINSDIQKKTFEKRAWLAIKSSKIFKGMASEHVIRSWGQPDDINSSTGSYGVHEQWVYRRSGSMAQYVYIKNDKVTSWGDN